MKPDDVVEFQIERQQDTDTTIKVKTLKRKLLPKAG